MNNETRRLLIIFLLSLCVLYTCGVIGRVVENFNRRIEKIESKTTPNKFKNRFWTDEKKLEVYVQQLVDKYAKQYKIDPRLVHAIMVYESLSHPRVNYSYVKARTVRSKAGAIGFLQVMPVHARWHNLPVAALEDPEINIKFGCAIFADQIKIAKKRGYKNVVAEALRMYNSGAGIGNGYKHRLLYRNWHRYVFPILREYEVQICKY